MEKRELSVLERLFGWLAERMRENRIPLLCGIAAGLLAHMFAFTNKLVNADEVWSLFERGATITSGRWGLELSKWIFPSISMPWIYGVISIVLLTVTACVTIRLFQIRSRCLQALLAAVFVSFPSETGLFCFMFTSAPYALAFLLAVIAVALAERGGKVNWLMSFLLLVLAMGTYQAYVAVVASFFVIRMIQRLLRGEGSAKEVLLYGVYRLGLLIVSLVVYYLISLAAARLSGLGFADYGVSRWTSIFYKIALAYSAFLHTFTRGYFAFVRSPLAMILHFLLALAAAVLLLRWLLRCKDRARGLLLVICLLLFPLSAYCIYLIAEVDIIHSLVLVSFLSVYVLAAVVVETAEGKAGRWSRDAVLLSLLLVMAGNVLFANKVYLKMHFQYEQAYSIYTSIITQIESTEGFDADKKVAIVGNGDQQGLEMEELDAEGLMGPSKNLIDIYTRELFMQRYLGFDVSFATTAERRALQKDERVQAMPCYPYYGSVQVIDDYIVVRLD